MFQSHNYRLLLLALFLLPGCAAARQWSNKLSSNVDERKTKREIALAEFEQRRTEAQLQAAAARLEQGDTAEARRMLTEILARKRDCREASLLLADVCIVENDVEAAEEVLLAALRQNTDAADIHHALGSVLELADRLPEAKAHFARACQLVQGNPAYQESLAGLEQIPTGEPLVATAPEAPAKRKLAAVSFSDAK